MGKNAQQPSYHYFRRERRPVRLLRAHQSAHRARPAIPARAQPLPTRPSESVVTIFAGAHIKPGSYPEGRGITHVNVLRTIEAMYGLPNSGAQQPNAAGGGIADETIITDVFESRP